MLEHYAAAMSLWGLVTVWLIWESRRFAGASVGLGLAYILHFAQIHLPGALVFSDGRYQLLQEPAVWLGFKLSTLGAVCFAIGFAVSRPLVVESATRLRPVGTEWAAIYRLTAIGVLFWVIIAPMLTGVPTINAISANIGQLTIVGLIFGNWMSGHGDVPRGRRMMWLLAPLGAPFLTLLLLSFVGYGVAAAITVYTFVWVYFNRSKKILLVLPILVFLGLSFYVSYMEGRRDYREITTAGATVGERLDGMARMIDELQFFDLDDPRHRYLVDARLNQNWLVGLAARQLDRGLVSPANGETLLDAFLALIPRAIWPNKPVVGGGGDLVSFYSGIEFARGTSVGAGQVLEFYVNFETVGVVLGFFLLGVVIRVFDSRASAALREADLRRATFWLLPSLGLMQAGGNLVEVVTSTVVGFFAAWIALRLVPELQRRMVRGNA